jgi:hypothetical protein
MHRPTAVTYDSNIKQGPCDDEPPRRDTEVLKADAASCRYDAQRQQIVASLTTTTRVAYRELFLAAQDAGCLLPSCQQRHYKSVPEDKASL